MRVRQPLLLVLRPRDLKANARGSRRGIRKNRAAGARSYIGDSPRIIHKRLHFASEILGEVFVVVNDDCAAGSFDHPCVVELLHPDE